MFDGPQQQTPTVAARRIASVAGNYDKLGGVSLYPPSDPYYRCGGFNDRMYFDIISAEGGAVGLWVDFKNSLRLRELCVCSNPPSVLEGFGVYGLGPAAASHAVTAVSRSIFFLYTRDFM